jgi:hypothetical protein
MRSNCFLFAIAFCWRRRKKRDWHFSVRMSKNGPFLHALCGRVTQDGKVRLVSYTPRYPVKRKVPPPLFDGFVKWGDR